MSQEERWRSRDMSYSVWHRRQSTRRFVGIEKAQLLAMIDLDGIIYVEYDDGSKEPIALVEIAKDVGQSTKPATVTKNLAKRCNPQIRAYVVLYRHSTKMNPADTSCFDINQFRVRRIWPEPETQWLIKTPQEWAELLCKIRQTSTDPLDGVDTWP